MLTPTQRSAKDANDPQQQDIISLIRLCAETMQTGGSVLVFCPTKKWCEKSAMRIAEGLRDMADTNILGMEAVEKRERDARRNLKRRMVLTLESSSAAPGGVARYTKRSRGRLDARSTSSQPRRYLAAIRAWERTCEEEGGGGNQFQPE